MTTQLSGVQRTFQGIAATLILVWLGILAVSFGAPGRILAAGADAAPPPTPSAEEPEALTRGPVHEAFAEPVDMQNDKGLTAPEAPPANLNETPPSVRPTGADYVWISGYWAWDADRKAHIWVSGCWRVAPPHTYWVPGYWSLTSGGYEWIPGFWAPDSEQDLVYLAEPPALVTVEAVGAPPTVDSVWIPPCWYWESDRFVLRAGYWLRAQPGWVWCPSHYVRTPHGFIFVRGCWDFDLDRRGVLFAPVYVRPGLAVRAGFVFSPGLVLDFGALEVNLFAYPRYCHYVFGDYYDAAYVRIGIHPWFEAGREHGWYDPIFVTERWHHERTDPHWTDHVRQDFDARQKDKSLRPATTYAAMNAQVAKLPPAQRASVQIAQPINVVVNNKTTNIKYERIDTPTREAAAKQANITRDLGQQRTKWEAPAAGGKANEPAPPSRSGNAAPPPRAERGPAPAAKNTEPPPAARDSRGPAVTAPPKESPRPVAPPPDQKTPAGSSGDSGPVHVRVPRAPAADRGSSPGGDSSPPGPADEVSHRRRG